VLTPGTFIADSPRVLNHLKSAFGGDTALEDLTASRISEYKGTRLATKVGNSDAERLLTAAAVNRPLALLRHLLRTAHEEWEILPAVPKIRLEKEPQGRLRWLTEDEIRKLLDACSKSRNRDLRAAVVVALNTGLRRSELLGLTWDRVDLSRGVICLEVTKIGKRREVPLNAESYAALVRLNQRESARVFRNQSLRKAYENAVSNCGSLRSDYCRFFLHRARTARRAISRRSSGGTPSQRALPPLGPPFLPPFRPRATAWGFFLRAIVRPILASAKPQPGGILIYE